MPVVDVRKIKPNADICSDESFSVQYHKALSEVSKYTAKFSDIICDSKKLAKKRKKISEAEARRMTDKTILVLDEALRNRRLVAFGGDMKKTHKLLNLEDPVDGNLVITDNEDDIRDDLKHVLIKYSWVIGLSDFFRSAR